MNTQLPKLQFPASQYRIKEEKGKQFIYDMVRLKYVALTPEEWVRQNCIQYLRNYKGFSITHMGIERLFDLNGQKFRFDIVGYSKNAEPLILIECKAPDVELSQTTFDQVVVYNMAFNVPVLMMTNGLKHLICQLNSSGDGYTFIDNLPSFNELLNM